MDKRKVSVVQLLRHVIQIAGFIVMPGMFILILSAIETIIKSTIGGTLFTSSMLTPVIILLAVIPVTIVGGRFFCGYLCAFGSMQELMAFVASKLKIKQIKVSHKTDKILKWGKYVVLVAVIVAWIMNLSLNTLSPWNVFGIYSSYKGWSDLSSLISVGGMILLIIIVMSMFKERFFCRYLCPLGGIFGALSSARLYRVKKNTSCVKCGMCSKKCPMGIDVNKETGEHGEVVSGECIDCFKCANVCNPNALYTSPKGIAVAVVSVAIIAGVYYGGNALVDSSSNTTSSTADTNSTGSIGNGSDNSLIQSDADSLEEALLQIEDGTYQGSGEGYRGTTTVTVTVKDGKITDITVDDYADDNQFFNKAKTTVINEIISGQTTDVDSVSGATFSSNGIMEAVADALGISFDNPNSDMVSSHGKKGGRH